jgi:hypothetical protein
MRRSAITILLTLCGFDCGCVALLIIDSRHFLVPVISGMGAQLLLIGLAGVAGSESIVRNWALVRAVSVSTLVATFAVLFATRSLSAWVLPCLGTLSGLNTGAALAKRQQEKETSSVSLSSLVYFAPCGAFLISTWIVPERTAVIASITGLLLIGIAASRWKRRTV